MVPVLEMFEFARVVIDEYTYSGDLEQAIPLGIGVLMGSMRQNRLFLLSCFPLEWR